MPGPFIAKITSSWLAVVDLLGDRTTTIHELHQKYGPSVRIGPREISFSNTEMVKTIYGQRSDFMKAPVYDHFSVHPVGIFSMRDRVEHGQRRRLLSHVFSQSNLLETEALIGQIIEKMTARVRKEQGRPVDALGLFRLTALEIVGTFFLRMCTHFAC